MRRRGIPTSLLKKKSFFLIFILSLVCSQVLGSNSHVFATVVITENSLTNDSSSERFEGYNLFVVDHLNKTSWGFLNRSLLITDLEGNIYIERELNPVINLGDCPAEFINSTTIMYGDLGGTKLWNLETNVTENTHVMGHHDYEKNHVKDTYYSFTWYQI